MSSREEATKTSRQILAKSKVRSKTETKRQRQRKPIDSPPVVGASSAVIRSAAAVVEGTAADARSPSDERSAAAGLVLFRLADYVCVRAGMDFALLWSQFTTLSDYYNSTDLALCVYSIRLSLKVY